MAGPGCVPNNEGNHVILYEGNPACATYYPWYDAILEVVNFYTPDAINFTYSGVNNGVDPFYYTDRQVEGLKLQGINKANFDWQSLYAPATAQLHHASGGENVLATDISVAILDNFANYDLLDVWYPPSTFRKYGIFGFGYNATEMPVKWINLTPCTMASREAVGYEGYMYAMRDGVTCDITTYQRMFIPKVTSWGNLQSFPI